MVFPSIKIFVKIYGGKNLVMSTFECDTTEQLKGQIQAKEGIPPALMRLRYGGKWLPSDSKLSEHNIVVDGIVYCLVDWAKLFTSLCFCARARRDQPQPRPHLATSDPPTRQRSVRLVGQARGSAGRAGGELGLQPKWFPQVSLQGSQDAVWRGRFIFRRPW